MNIGDTSRCLAAFVYHSSRSFADFVPKGKAPDTGLYGQNHLADYGIDATILEGVPRALWCQRRAGRLAWAAREAALAWETRSFDVVCTTLAKLLPLVAMAVRVPTVVLMTGGTCNDLRRSSPAQRAVIVGSLRTAAAIVCLAESQRRSLIDLARLDPRRVHTLLLGVDLAFFRPHESRRGAYVLAAGRDSARDYATLVAAARELPVRVVIVASRRNVVGIDLPPNVELQLDIDHRVLRDLYADALCAVIPTRREEYEYGADCSGQSVLLDAMAMACPIVVSQRSTLVGYVNHDESALIVTPEDPPALRAAIERLLTEDGLGTRLGRAARRRVESGLSSRNFAAHLAPLLISAASRATTPSRREEGSEWMS